MFWRIGPPSWLWTGKCEILAILGSEIWTLYRQNLYSLPGGNSDKEPVCQCRKHKRCGFKSPGQKDPPRGGHVNPLQYSCLENPMDTGTWCATVHRTQEPGGLQSTESQRVENDWSNLRHTQHLLRLLKIITTTATIQ